VKWIAPSVFASEPFWKVQSENERTPLCPVKYIVLHEDVAVALVNVELVIVKAPAEFCW
jgi:hypothetical protein